MSGILFFIFASCEQLKFSKMVVVNQLYFNVYFMATLEQATDNNLA